jgi:signal transduction histidine kinase
VITVSLKNAVAYQKLAEITATIDSKVKESNDAVEAAKQRMVAMDASKDEFISIASHELRTPITAIKGYLWLCLNQAKQPLSPDVKKNIETCYHSAERLLRMVSDMLTVSRMDENKMALNIQKLDIASLIKGIHEELKPAAQTREIEFTVKTSKPSLMIEADRERLQELFHNIIDNAIKFVPHRGIVSVEMQENGDRDVSVLVRDNGPGIPKENMDKLFTKFGKIQYAYDKTHAVEGAGLGLYISKKIVDLHSGIISVESDLDKGTTFIITLPLRIKK